MKKIFLAAAIFVPLVFFSCTKKISLDIPKLPEPVGEDVFAGKTFLCETGQMKFGNNHTVLISSVDYEQSDGSQMVDDYMADYSYNSESQELYIVARQIYVNGKLTKSINEFMDERMDEMETSIKQMTDEGTMVIDKESKKNYSELIKKSYESFGRSLLETTLRYGYKISDEGQVLTITEIPSDSPISYSINGTDDSKQFQITLFGSELVFEENFEDIDSIPESTGTMIYYGFVDWNKDHSEFSGTVYSVHIAESFGEEYVQTFVSKKEGPINGSMNFSITKHDGFFDYFADFNFSNVPDCLKNIKTASLGNVMQTFTGTYILAQ